MGFVALAKEVSHRSLREQILPSSLLVNLDCFRRSCERLTIRIPVNIIREEIDTSWSGTHYLWTSVITAPWSPESGWTTWTCRASHVTSWDLPPHITTPTDARRGLPFIAHPTVTGRLREIHHESHSGHGQGHGSSETISSPTISHQHPRTLTTLPAHLNNARRLAELAELEDDKAFFKRVANSVATDGEDVITLEGYLHYFNVTDLTRGTAYGRGVIEKFHWQDRNRDGVLTFMESQLRCDADGCDEADSNDM